MEDLSSLGSTKRSRGRLFDRKKRSTASLAPREDGWQPPIVKTVAPESKGIEELAGAIESYRDFHFKTELGNQRRRAVARWRILELLRERLLAQTLGSPAASESLDRLACEVARRERDPYSAVEEIINMR